MFQILVLDEFKKMKEEPILNSKGDSTNDAKN
jgi:hypothetical protein